MDVQQLRKLCEKAVTGNINNTEEILLNKQLAESEEFRAEYESVKNIWAKSSPSEITQVPDIEMEWNKLNNRIESAKTGYYTKDSIYNKINSGINSLFSPKVRPAFGSAFVVLLLVTGIFIFRKEAPELLQYKVISTLNKETRQVQLSDGSIVYLNSGSTLKFPERFDDKVREVSLKGEAFFSVTKGKGSFTVITGNARTTVLGTKFNVRARDEKTEVFVKEGRVNLALKAVSSNSVILSKGQLSRIVKNELPTKPADVKAEYFIGWMRGELAFNQTSLKAIVEELERTYNTKINFENENIKTTTLTGTFNNDNPDSVLSMICLTLELDFEKQQNGYLIKSKKNN